MYKDDVIYMVTNATTAVAANATVPLQVIGRRRGNAFNLVGYNLQLRKVGYYLVNGTITFTGAAGAATLTLNKDNVAINGATTSDTIGTANTEIHTLPINTVVRVICNEGQPIITLVNTGVAISVTNVSLTVTYIG